MGNYRFRLSDMMPNAWFYKLRDMSRTRNHHSPHSNHRRLQPAPEPGLCKRNHYEPVISYQCTEPTTRFCTSPVNLKASRDKRSVIYHPSPNSIPSSASENSLCHATFNVDRSKCHDQVQCPESHNSLIHAFLLLPEKVVASETFDGVASLSSSSSCNTSSTADIVINVAQNSFTTTIAKGELDEFHNISEANLPPIFTKPSMSQQPTTSRAIHLSRECKLQQEMRVVKEKLTKTRAGQQKVRSLVFRKWGSNYTTRIKLHASSRRQTGRKGRHSCRPKSRSPRRSSNTRSFLEGFAIVKSSFDPQRDFQESMVEMILENNIRSPKDLEELLACYLSLNSDEYHNLIIKSFQQIWSDIGGHHL